jgi:ATP/maltotriose-dependent transcriptional regulator MalT
MTNFLHDPVLPAAPDLSTVDPSLLAHAPDRLLALAADLLTWGDTARGGEYLDLLEHAQPTALPDPELVTRSAVMRSFHYGVSGQLDEAVSLALAARASQERTPLTDEWDITIPLILLRLHNCLEDYEAVEREAVAAQAMPSLTEVARLVLVPGARALAWLESGRLADAADAALAAGVDARRLGFGHHFFAVDHLRALAGLALERRDLDTAERLAEQALSIVERRRPLFEFLTLLDRARIWAARGQVREALARIALATDDHHTAQEHLRSPSLGELTPGRALERQVLLAAAAIGRGDPLAAGILGGALHTARQERFLNTVVAAAPQVASYLIEHAAQAGPDPFMEQLIAAALEVRAVRSAAARSPDVLAEPLTAAELRILKLLPTSTYLQMAATLYVSRNTVKTHLRSVYQKLGVASRAEAIERALDLQLL